MPAVATQVSICRVISSPVPQTDDCGQHGQRDDGEGVEPKGRAYEGQHDGGYGQHGYPLSAAQALTNW